MPEQLLTTLQVAEILAIREEKVRALCQRGSKHGGLDAGKIDSQWRIPVDEVNKFIDHIKRKG
ncbi:MAG: helix-turn-helix domain-containing protein [Syntrophaceae bacterium]|jgi:hypothetical protein